MNTDVDVGVLEVEPALGWFAVLFRVRPSGFVSCS